MLWTHTVSQSVKEVLDSLLADNIVDTDKIGTSVLYWAFPSKASQIVRTLPTRPDTPACPNMLLHSTCGHICSASARSRS